MQVFFCNAISMVSLKHISGFKKTAILGLSLLKFRVVYSLNAVRSSSKALAHFSGCDPLLQPITQGIAVEMMLRLVVYF